MKRTYKNIIPFLVVVFGFVSMACCCIKKQTSVILAAKEHCHQHQSTKNSKPADQPYCQKIFQSLPSQEIVFKLSSDLTPAKFLINSFVFIKESRFDFERILAYDTSQGPPEIPLYLKHSVLRI